MRTIVYKHPAAVRGLIGRLNQPLNQNKIILRIYVAHLSVKHETGFMQSIE